MKEHKYKSNKKSPISELFSGTSEYYTKYRPGIPKEVIDIIVSHFNISPKDRILDIGCGTGQVTLAMAGRCGEMVCLDSDSEMLRQAKLVTRKSNMKVVWVNCSSQDLGRIKKRIGTFKVATICRSFHWLNQEQVLKDLDDLIDEDGGVAIFSDRCLWTGDEEWQRAVKEVIQKYLGKERCAGKGKFKASEERWENILARSVFRFIKTHDVPIVRSWDVESIIGYVFSTSFAAPPLFGDQLDKFKEEVKTTLLTLNPRGVFQENAVWSMILASRKKH